MQKIKYFIITKSIGLWLNLSSYTNLKMTRARAYQLFSHPRKGKLYQANLPKTLKNASLETFQYDNENFQTYIWHGTRGVAELSEANKDIILLVHGWESNSSRWKKLLPYLKPLGKTIISIDAPAHGLSDGIEFNAPKYAECLHVLIRKYQPKIVIGHSIGGAAIAYYLNKYQNPEIQKVVLLGAPSDFKILSDNFIKLLSLNSKIEKELENFYLEKFNIHIDDFSGHKFAKNFSQKALIAHDTEDKVVLIDEGRKYAKTWKNAIYIETTGLGHSMHDAELYQKIADFIE